MLPMAAILSKIRTTLEMISGSLDLCAALCADSDAAFAAGGLPGWRTVAWIVVAMWRRGRGHGL